MKIIVAMSGGVDSAVAAALLVRRGHAVEGLTLQLADLGARGLSYSRCCSIGDIELAARVCWQLGIAHRVLDLGKLFREEVLDPFVDGYLAGETPSPCPRCNARVKLGAVLDRLDQLDADVLATGHYARLAPGKPATPRLLRGRDSAKDQSYFLFELSRTQLARLCFPLGELAKAEVRAIAADLGLPNAARAESQEMCFIPPHGTYLDVLEALAPDRVPQPGAIVDSGGNVVGRHLGIHRFTVGQRRGLGLGGATVRYVNRIDAARREVVVGSTAELRRSRLEVRDVNWLIEPASNVLDADVQIRYRHQPQRAMVRLAGRANAIVDIPTGVTAPAPGQAAVFYEGDTVLGGGWIQSAT